MCSDTYQVNVLNQVHIPTYGCDKTFLRWNDNVLEFSYIMTYVGKTVLLVAFLFDFLAGGRCSDTESSLFASQYTLNLRVINEKTVNHELLSRSRIIATCEFIYLLYHL